MQGAREPTHQLKDDRAALGKASASNVHQARVATFTLRLRPDELKGWRTYAADNYWTLAALVRDAMRRRINAGEPVTDMVRCPRCWTKIEVEVGE